MCKLKNNDNKKNKIYSVIISYITIFNFMYLENLYFTENIVMSISILLFLIAANLLIENKNKCIVFLLVLIGTFCYQGTINLFITFYFLLEIIKNKKINKELIKNMLIVILICISSILINIIQIKICGNIFNMTQTRMGGINEILNNIVQIFKNMDLILIKNSELFPKYLLLVFLGIIVIITSIYDKIKQNKFVNLINIFLIIIVAIGSSVAINIFSLSSFGLGRMVFSVGALIGFIFMYLYCRTYIFEEIKLKKILTIIIIIYTIILIWNQMFIFYQHKLANELDKAECKKVGEYIRKYEEENNIKVKKICYCYDNDVEWYYKELIHNSLYTHRALMIWWCNIDAINFYNNLELEKVKMSGNVYKEYFEGKNWDELNEEQFIFIDDTLYYCVY